jgi:hypothetical protein
MLLELLRLLRKPQRYLASYRNGEIYIEEAGTKRRAPALQGSDLPASSGR